MNLRAKRPDRAELEAKLARAREQLRLGRLFVANVPRFRRELTALDWYSPDQISGGLATVFAEVRPEHYSGRTPPERAIERECLGAELFPFAWHSGLIEERMYLKLAVNDRGSVWIVSLHRSSV
jgi:hypothetical protein